jgi:exosortase/archaeosortase family protein
MTPKDWSWLGFLALGALGIWLRDRRWTSEAGDVLPALAGFPLMAWLGAPWRWQPGPFRLHTPSLILAALAAVVGSALGLTVLLALAWTAALWAWLQPRLAPADQTRIRRLLLLPFAAFPWIALDLQPLGWWFRLTGARATEFLFGGLGFEVSREGTHLLVQGMPIEVSAACAGMNALQSVLLAGVFLAYILLGQTKAYLWNLLLLVPLAWLANTARIVTITAAAITWGSDFAMGMFHTWGGLLILFLMFTACWATFQCQANGLARRA